MVWILEPAAYRLGLLDYPGGRKDQGHPSPIIGGLAMVIAIMVPVVAMGEYARSFLGFMLGGLVLVAWWTACAGAYASWRKSQPRW